MARKPDPIHLTGQLKFCTGCEKQKDTGYFYSDANKSDGLSTRCKECKLGKTLLPEKEASVNMRRLRASAKLIGIRMCASCNEAKNDSDFYDRETRCKKCCSRRASDYSRQKKRGWSVEAYNASYQNQEGKCAICSTWQEVLHGDHCHETGKIRKLLCQNCNLAIGLMKENPERLRLAAEYCESHQLLNEGYEDA